MAVVFQIARRADQNIVMRVGRERVRCNEINKLTNCAPNSCVVFPYKDAWMRNTQNDGSRGSIRYAMFKNLDDALSAGVGGHGERTEKVDEHRMDAGHFSCPVRNAGLHCLALGRYSRRAHGLQDRTTQANLSRPP